MFAFQYHHENDSICEKCSRAHCIIASKTTIQNLDSSHLQSFGIELTQKSFYFAVQFFNF